MPHVFAAWAPSMLGPTPLNAPMLGLAVDGLYTWVVLVEPPVINNAVPSGRGKANAPTPQVTPPEFVGPALSVLATGS